MKKSLALLAGAAGLVASCTGAPAPSPVAVPEALRPPSGESLAMIVPAKGVQIYECRAVRERAGAYEWAFVAPEAELLDISGAKIGRHYAGPTWEAADGSKLAGVVKARADVPQSGAIPWLLLTTTANGGPGRFSKITAIQRVNTVGGIAPSMGCAAGNAGATARVAYTADYYFLRQ